MTDEGRGFRPELFICLNQHGDVLASAIGRAPQRAEFVASGLHQALNSPLVGGRQVPGRVRVETPELAQLMRHINPRLQVICAPTPEVTLFLAGMAEHLQDNAEPPRPSYLSSDVAAEVVAEFFRAAAALYRARPWEVLPGDDSTLEVSCEALGIARGVVSVIGQAQTSYGFLLFPSEPDFEAFLEMAEQGDAGAKGKIPPHLALNFERRADLNPEFTREVEEYGWELAGPDAYPWLIVGDHQVMGRNPTSQELAVVTAMAGVLPEFLGDKTALLAALEGEQFLERTFELETHLGRAQLGLCFPYEPDEEEDD